jgi:predicted RNase H-like nuclease (RuvC/YqgF family)
MSTRPSPGWLTIRQAAAALNVSELTIRRRIKDGKVAHRLESGKYFVNLDLPIATVVPRSEDETSPVEESTHVVTPTDVHDFNQDRPLTGFDRFLPELTRLAGEAGRAEQLRDQIHALEERCAELQREVVTLAGRNGWLESQLQEREKEVRQLTDSHPRRGWWRRFG